MINQYTKFFITGAILAFIAWGLQLLIYEAIERESALAYALASAITLVPLVCTNFLIQRLWVFKRSGFFVRFMLADLSIIILVSILSPVCREVISILAGIPWGNQGGFITAVLLSSIPSFFLRRHWVFTKTVNKKKKATRPR